MNAATKSTPSKAAPAKRAEKTAPPPLDFKTVTVADAAAPTRSGGVAPADNPLLEHFDASIAGKTEGKNGTWKGAGKSLVVPTANVTQVQNLIRYAANLRKCGSAIETKSEGRGMTRVTFCAKNRKAPRKTATTAAPATGTTPSTP